MCIRDSLSADCGPIVLNSTLQYDRSSIDGQSYGSIRKNTLAVYFSGSKICDADGNSVDTASQQLVDATSLIDLCYQSILNGSAGCDKASDGYLYGLSLDSDAMSELAAAIGSPNASRAVGMANHRNPISIVIPCHRVIGANGTLTGYAGGLEVKRKLLALEGINILK